MGHIIPLFAGGLIFLSLELFLLRPQWLFYEIGAMSLFLILGLSIPKRKFLSGKEFWHFLTNPLIFVWSSVVLLLFFENIYFKHFFVLGVGTYVFLYFENLFYYLISGRGGGDSSFLRMTNMMNVVSVFFLAAGFYGIKTFIQLPMWLLTVVFFIFSGGLIYASLWTIKHNLREIYAEILVIALITSEMFLAINLLPLSFYAAGAVAGIIFYVLSGVMINFLKDGEIVYKRYVVTGSILLLLVAATARWV